MSFHDGSGKSSHRRSDPITEAVKRGKPPTLGEVKKSVKVGINNPLGDLLRISHRRLVSSQEARQRYHADGCTAQQALHIFYHDFIGLITVFSERRYATFKLFYYDNTPADYEPPHFLPGDAVKDRWFFTTHGKEEVPEKWSLGGLETGHHG